MLSSSSSGLIDAADLRSSLLMADHQEAVCERSRGSLEVARLSLAGQQEAIGFPRDGDEVGRPLGRESTSRGEEDDARCSRDIKFSEGVLEENHGQSSQSLHSLEHELSNPSGEERGVSVAAAERCGLILDERLDEVEKGQEGGQTVRITEEEFVENAGTSLSTSNCLSTEDEATRIVVAKRRSSSSSDVSQKTDFRVSGFLIRQLRELAAKERDLESRLGREKIEHVMEKVEDEVEFEGVMEEMWLNMQADAEAQDMERRELTFEMERREVQLEDEVSMLQGKVRRLEDELRLAHAEKDYVLQKKQDEMDDIIRSMLSDIREGGGGDEQPRGGDKFEGDGGGGGDLSKRVNLGQMMVAAVERRPAAVSPHKAVFLAFEDMLKEADERAEHDRHVIESTLLAKQEAESNLQQEQRRSHEKERQLESRLLAVEKEVSRLSGVLREAELALSVEQERRTEARTEADQMLETWREEKKFRKESEDKVKRLLAFLMHMKEKLTNEEEGGGEERLASVVKELDKELQKMNAKKSSVKRSKAIEVEQASRWKAQRDAVEAERDKLEEKLNLQLRRARDREGEIDAMWAERERNLATKCSHLEADVAHWESKHKKREVELGQERKRWEAELEGYRKQWASEKAGWEALVLQREEWLEDQVARWAALLDGKDREMAVLKTANEELKEVLKADKQRHESLQQHVHYHQKEMLENSSQTSISCESDKRGRNILEEQEEESCQTVERFVRDVDNGEEGHDGAERVLEAVDKLEKEKAEKEELQKKVTTTLKMVDELQTKLEQVEGEKQELESSLSSKASEVEHLVEQINSRECQMEALMQKFRDEVLSIDREVEKERKEREEVMEMHFVGKRRLVTEMREKEEIWQNEFKVMSDELLELREEIRRKEDDIAVLRENLQALDEHRMAEEQKLARRVSSLLQEKDVLTAALEQEQNAREIAETENQKLEEENVILLDELNAERRRSLGAMRDNTNSWRNIELQAAAGRVASADKQIGDAMTTIETLQEELKAKEMQLVEVKADKEAEWAKREAALGQEHKEMLEMQERKWQQEWQSKEKSIALERERLLQQLNTEKEEAAAMQGVLRELEWSVKHGDSDGKAKLVELPKKEGMVKVHTSHLEDVDQYVLDLQLKLEESEKKRKSAEVALSVQDLKRAASIDASYLQFDRDGRVLPNMPVRHDGNLTSHLSLENGIESLRIRTRSSLGERSARSSFSSIREMQPDSYWEGGNTSTSIWHGQGRDDFSLSVLPPVSPGRRQQKWLVDAVWLEHVRKVTKQPSCFLVSCIVL